MQEILYKSSEVQLYTIHTCIGCSLHTQYTPLLCSLLVQPVVLMCLHELAVSDLFVPIDEPSIL